MTPLQITARIRGGISLPHGPLALDSLLAARVAVDLDLPPPRHARDCQPIEIPVKLEPGGRFHLASFSVSKVEAFEVRWLNRRAPIEQYQLRGNKKVRRAQITAGPDKSYRLPLEVRHLALDQLVWWCLGDAVEIERLLSGVHYLGKRRGVGLGTVTKWQLDECDPWGDGFPVMRDGIPLRPLPLDWQGLVGPPQAFRTLTYPYWDHTKETLCAVPGEG